jgi:sensor domain CHASE-containing protein
VRWPPKLLAKINYLAGGLASGDFGPTKQQREVQALLKQQLTAVRQRLDAVLSQDLTAFNKLLTDNNIKPIKP